MHEGKRIGRNITEQQTNATNKIVTNDQKLVGNKYFFKRVFVLSMPAENGFLDY